MNIEEMSIYHKIQEMKKELGSMSIPKTGKNKHDNYTYYELKDIQPSINKLAIKYNVFLQFSFTSDNAILNIMNLDNPKEMLEKNSPMPRMDLTKAIINVSEQGIGRKVFRVLTNAAQGIGAVQTYQKRYMLIDLFDISEEPLPDIEDEQEQESQKKNTNKSNEEDFKEDTEAIKLLNDLKTILLDPKDPKTVTKSNLLKLAKDLNKEKDNNFNIDTKMFSSLRKQIQKEGIK